MLMENITPYDKKMDISGARVRPVIRPSQNLEC